MIEKERKILMGKSNEVAAEKQLGGTEIVETDNGRLNREIIPFCDFCGRRLDDKIIICQIGQHKICTECSVKYDQRNTCIGCMKEKHPLTKREFKVLLAIFSGLVWTRGIRKVTRVPKDGISEAIQILSKAGFIERRWFWLYITDDGMDILTVYGKIYSSERDIESVKTELKRLE